MFKQKAIKQEIYLHLKLLKRFFTIMKKNISSLFALLFFMTLSFQGFSEDPVSWKSISDIEENTSADHVFIDVYTDWCGWCKKMDRETFSHPIISEILNEHFIPVKFNAESTQDLFYNGKTYKKNSKVHSLALEFSNNSPSYPAYVVVKRKSMEVLAYIPGYQTAQEFEKIISYFQHNAYEKNIPFEVFKENYKSKIVTTR